MPLDKRIVNQSEIQKKTLLRCQLEQYKQSETWGIPVNTEYENNKKKMEILITERTEITPLLEIDWMKRVKLTIGRIQLAENNQSEKECSANFRIWLEATEQ